MENSIKMDDLGKPTIFGNISYIYKYACLNPGSQWENKLSLLRDLKMSLLGIPCFPVLGQDSNTDTQIYQDTQCMVYLSTFG